MAPIDRTTGFLGEASSPLTSASSPFSLSGSFAAAAATSPFLQVDPAVLTGTSGVGTPGSIANEFIFADGGTKPQRGRFEMAFAQIGGSCMLGAGIGGAIGTYRGLRDVALASARETPMANATVGVRRAHLLNCVTRNGARIANSFGTLALIYSATGVALSFAHDYGDEWNTGIAATATGTLYGALGQAAANGSAQNLQGPALTRFRLKRAGIGFAAGFIAAIALIIATSSDREIDSWRDKFRN